MEDFKGKMLEVMIRERDRCAKERDAQRLVASVYKQEDSEYKAAMSKVEQLVKKVEAKDKIIKSHDYENRFKTLMSSYKK